MTQHNSASPPPRPPLPQEPSPRRASLPRRLCIGLAAALLVLVLAQSGSLYMVCVFKPELVTAAVQQQLIESTGLPWRIRGSIRPSFRGGPGIVARDVRIIAASTDQGHYANAVRPLVHAKSLRIVLDLGSLLRLRPLTERIELNEPTVNLVYDGLGRPLWLPPEEEPADEAFTVKPDAGVVLKSVAEAVCSPYHAAMQPLIIHKGTFVSYTQEGEVLLSFTGVEGRFTPGAENDNLRLSAAFDLPGADLAVSFDVRARVGCEGIPARGSLKGGIAMTPPGSRTVKADFSTAFVWENDGRTVSLPDFTLSAEGDLLSAELTADLAVGAFTGPVAIHTLSLPRWFEWARILPPGLQAALHGLSGGFDLDLTMDKAMALNLTAEAGGLRISGLVGAPDFSAPSIITHVSIADTPDLDVILPFLGVPGRWIPPPKAPEFDHPPLAPYPEAPPAPYDPGPSSVGYDINIALDRAVVHGVTGGPIKVRVSPHMAGEVEKTRVGIEGENLLGGSVKGHLDIDKYAILMRYEVKNADLALLPENQGSDVRIAGRATGSCEIDMPMNENGSIADDWPLRIDATVSGCEISGVFRKRGWKLRLARAEARGSGSIYAVLEKGVRLSGNWNLDAKGVSTPWQPSAKDALSGTYQGTLYWPVILGGPPVEGKKPERKTLDRVAGDVNMTGSVTLPRTLGAFPLAGSLKSAFDWSVPNDRLAFTDTEFKGHGSYLEGEALLDVSGAESLFTASPSFTANPARLLRDWKIAIPQGMRVPGLLTGRLDVNMKGSALRLEKLKVEVDGAPITGDIAFLPDEDPAGPDRWILRLAAQHLDVENIFPPAEPGKRTPASATPWNLDFFRTLSLDANIQLHNAKKGKLAFDRSTLRATAHKDRFTVEIDTAGFYGGSSLVIAQGTVVPGSSQVTLRKGLIHMKDVALGDLLYDMTGKRSYAGTAELVADLKGQLGCNADIPGKLSGNWSLTIIDGLYPGFLTSETSTLRNTFSRAGASGPMDRGVLRSNNFTLSGTMVDMTGGGWFDLNTRDLDLEVSVTFAKVPTVPVRFYGNASAPRMKVRGVDMVVETVQAAGSTIFGLVMGVLELPGRAIQGIGGMFDGQGKNSGGTGTTRQGPQTMPVRPTGRR